jgi:hypothetical protein
MRHVELSFQEGSRRTDMLPWLNEIVQVIFNYFDVVILGVEA